MATQTYENVTDSSRGPLALFIDAVEISHSETLGRGLRAKRDIPKDTVLWRNDRTGQRTSRVSLLEFLTFDRDDRREWVEYAWFDGENFWGPLRGLPLQQALDLEASNFSNHSCDPTMGFKDDHTLVTIRDVKAGEPLVVDYAMTEWLDISWQTMKCECGASNCRGEISIHDWRLPDVQARINGYAFSPVQRLIDLRNLPESFFGTDGSRELNRKIEVRPHPLPFIGRGLFAKEIIEEGELIWRHNGVESVQYPISAVMAEKDPAKRDFLLHYGYQVGKDTWSAPLSREWMEAGNDNSSYMNHSCDPTLAILSDDLWVARRRVMPGEELTYDYATTEIAFDRLEKCACGSDLCRGKVTKDDWKRQDLRRRYTVSFAPHVMEMMENEERWLQPEE